LVLLLLRVVAEAVREGGAAKQKLVRRVA